MNKTRTYDDYMLMCLTMKRVYNENIVRELVTELHKFPQSHYRKQLEYLIKAWDALGRQLEKKCYEETGKRMDC
jgi:hypothetical protein